MSLMKTMIEKSNDTQKQLKELKLEAKINRSGNPYIVSSVILKEKLVGVGSKNLTELEEVINAQCEIGYKLHTCSISVLGSEGIGGGDRLQATLIFEKI